MDESRQSNQPLNPAQANAILAEVDACPTIINVTRASHQFPALREAMKKVSLRLGCLSSFTFDPIRPFLELQGLRAGIAIDAYVGPYGQFDQELINPSSGLALFQPGLVLLAVRLQDVCPAVYEGFNALGEKDADHLVEKWLARLESAVRSFRAHSSAYILIQNYDLPASPSLGIADRAAAVSQATIIDRANEGLASLAASLDNVYVMDYDALVARHGRLAWTDRRMAYYARIAVASKYYWPLAGFFIRHMRPLYGLSKKVLVLDADNTLWGGVVGDVGVDGIALGHDYPGNTYVAFQRRVLELYNRGIVLCIASKNEPGSVDEVLEKHPDMVLRAKHFAAMRIDWNHKPDNLRAMAADLNLGLDSFVFVDDSAVECELMRQSLPEVETIHLPEEPALYAAVIESLDCFDQWAISAEDKKRGQLYKAQASRQALQSSTTDLPTFYRQLGMRITLSVDCPAHVARASQMTNRTNQFNMHTLRCSEDDIRRFVAADDYKVLTLALEDRFGDNGIVGLAVVRRASDEWTLHIFLMSCRVLGRTVEQTFVGWIAGQAREAGGKRLVGLFKATAKNKPFAGFYRNRGFVRAESEGDTERWCWELEGADCTPPDWFEINVI
ncbi:MAG: HAD-IIIC family phosphatase [Phycisphaerae bacterium]|nr:HAD-IIIC family phosphatase [Phycisphaerae bacterium]